ncbi:uncharacterized protein F4807DRAFT_464516 [Annulohypoxylon truncatum]|uniref:uncharacterized protein n=1 Tax=Annulohypoxylon truncatum TaxID=327061 RepID=UPI0020081D94|nr:uncharacterized protein F4807DRAFT_464516 [Annulohypoxylon truncatum]KAI1205635.1 hypothetical protein F4807DRAFT_464516 [Annulohypoxylon truncatum]
MAYLSVPRRDPVDNGEAVHLALEEAGISYSVGDSTDLIGLTNEPPPVLLPDDGSGPTSGTLRILRNNCMKIQLCGHGSENFHRIHATAELTFLCFNTALYEWREEDTEGLSEQEQRRMRGDWGRDWVDSVLPHHLDQFQNNLPPPAPPNYPWLHGDELSYADLLLFQCIDETKHLFPKAMNQARRSGRYGRIFRVYDSVKQRSRISSYLNSQRRRDNTAGIYCYHEEMDLESTAWSVMNGG